jgi:hypothetical protein
MEYTKFFVLAFFILLVGGGMTAYNQLQSIDSANADLLSAKSKLTQIKETIAGRRAELERLQKLQVRLAQALQQSSAGETALQEAMKKVRGHEVELKYLMNSLKESVAQARAAAVNQVIPELTLKGGKVARQARIRQIDAATVSIVHADGFLSVAPAELPQVIRDKYDLNTPSLVEQIEEECANLFVGKKK